MEPGADPDEGNRVISLGVVPWVGGQPRGAFEVFGKSGSKRQRYR